MAVDPLMLVVMLSSDITWIRINARILLQEANDCKICKYCQPTHDLNDWVWLEQQLYRCRIPNIACVWNCPHPPPTPVLYTSLTKYSKTNDDAIYCPLVWYTIADKHSHVGTPLGSQFQRGLMYEIVWLESAIKDIKTKRHARPAATLMLKKNSICCNRFIIWTGIASTMNPNPADCGWDLKFVIPFLWQCCVILTYIFIFGTAMLALPWPWSGCEVKY